MDRRDNERRKTGPPWGSDRRWLAVARAARPLVVLVPLGQVLAILWLVWARSTDVPMSDEWQMVEIVQHADEGELRVGDFWRLHGDAHRLVVPRLTALVLIELTGWHRRVMMTFNVAVVVLTGILLFQAVRETFRSTAVTVALVVPGSLFILSFTRYHNWLKPFTDKIPTAFGVAVCAWALAARPVGPSRFGVAVFGAMIASLSSLGGLSA